MTDYPSSSETPEEITLAKFDGTDTIDNADRRFGLEKMIFEKGYTVSFTSYYYGWHSNKNVLPIRIEGIDGVACGGETVLQKNWNRRYETATKIDYEGSYKSIYLLDETENFAVKAATYNTLRNPAATATPVAKVEYSKDGGAFIPVTASTVSLTEAGNYVLKYTAIEDGTQAGNQRIVRFAVVESYTDITEDIEVSLHGEYYSFYILNEPPTVAPATFSYPDRAELGSFNVEKIELKKGSGAYKEVQVGDVITAAGDYTLRYTAAVGGSSEGNTALFTFRVLANGFNVGDTVTMTEGNATVTRAHTTTEVINAETTRVHSGILIESNDGEGYKGNINAYFGGDSRIDFCFPGIPKTGSTLSGKFAFIFTARDNPDEYFKIWFVRGAVNFTYMYLEDSKGNLRITDRGDNIYTTEAEISKGMTSCLFGADRRVSSFIQLRWDEDGVLSVYASDYDNAANEQLIAKFDGTTAVDNEKKKYGLAKLSESFQNDYIISFESQKFTYDYNNEVGVAALKLEKISWGEDEFGEQQEWLLNEQIMTDVPEYYEPYGKKEE